MDGTTIGAAAAPPSEPDHGPALPYQDFRVRQAQIKVFDRSVEPDNDDASDVYVVEVFGVSVLIRLHTPRVAEAPELYVHIDNEGRPPIDLAIEINNRGETRYRL
ncbi:MAG: hypothetical protein QOE61_5607 [Micromonosporaceae bacterium]|jgi:hypothetical protein|nr:hypothetical protein [Micromonosporaceae bacterium]